MRVSRLPRCDWGVASSGGSAPGPELMPHRMSDRMSEHIPERMSDTMSEYYVIYIYIYNIHTFRWYVRNYVRMVCQASGWRSLEESSSHLST